MHSRPIAVSPDERENVIKAVFYSRKAQCRKRFRDSATSQVFHVDPRTSVEAEAPPCERRLPAEKCLQKKRSLLLPHSQRNLSLSEPVNTKQTSRKSVLCAYDKVRF